MCYSPLPMTDIAPFIKLPPGLTLRQDENGNLEVVANKEPMSKTVAFRLPASTYANMMALVESFPERSWGTAFRWLLDQPTVIATIATRIIDNNHT